MRRSKFTILLLGVFLSIFLVGIVPVKSEKHQAVVFKHSVVHAQSGTTNSGSDGETDNEGSDGETDNIGSDGVTDNKINNPLGSIGTIDEFLVKILEWVRRVALMIVLPLALIYGGFLFIKAQGKPEELQKAKRTFLYTVLGAAVIIGAELLVKIISETLTSL